MAERGRSRLNIDHMAIPITDPIATMKFYTGILELPLIAAHQGDDWGGMPWLMMIFALADDRQLAFIAFEGAKTSKSNVPKDARHTAFAVSSKAELRVWKAKLKRAGIDFWDEDHGTQHSIYFEDPNGIVLEITAPESAKSAKADPRAARIVEEWTARRPKARRK